MCGGVPPPSRQEFGKVVIHLAKGETEAKIMEFLTRNYGGIVAK
jgi:cytochrome c-type biogenesis protein CcmH/NrfF